MSRYELWQATRDLVQGRRRDTTGAVHGWLTGDWHDEERLGGLPRECLNGAIALAEAQVYRSDFPYDYQEVKTTDGAELKRVLAETIQEQYVSHPGLPTPVDSAIQPQCRCSDCTADPSYIIAWFNDKIASDEEGGQDAMNAILDKVELKLFESWWEDHDACAWQDLIFESEHLDELLPLV